MHMLVFINHCYMNCFEASGDLVDCAVQSSFNWTRIEPFQFWLSLYSLYGLFQWQVTCEHFYAYYWL